VDEATEAMQVLRDLGDGDSVVSDSESEPNSDPLDLLRVPDQKRRRD